MPCSREFLDIKDSSIVIKHPQIFGMFFENQKQTNMQRYTQNKTIEKTRHIAHLSYESEKEV